VLLIRANDRGAGGETAAAFVIVNANGDEVPLARTQLPGRHDVAIGRVQTILVVRREPAGPAHLRAVDVRFVGIVHAFDGQRDVFERPVGRQLHEAAIPGDPS
jgi:hypothetical protein